MPKWSWLPTWVNSSGSLPSHSISSVSSGSGAGSCCLGASFGLGGDAQSIGAGAMDVIAGVSRRAGSIGGGGFVGCV